MIKEKILALIYRRKNNQIEFLALKKNAADPIHGRDTFYVVTGGIEKGEKLTDAVKREIKEETGIEKIVNIQNLKKVYEYTHPAEGDYLCREFCFAVEADEGVKYLSAEHTEYKWLKNNDFIKKVDWYGDKKDLKELLSMLKN